MTCRFRGLPRAAKGDRHTVPVAGFLTPEDGWPTFRDFRKVGAAAFNPLEFSLPCVVLGLFPKYQPHLCTNRKGVPLVLLWLTRRVWRGRKEIDLLPYRQDRRIGAHIHVDVTVFRV